MSFGKNSASTRESAAEERGYRASKSRSLVARLNLRLFLRLLSIYLTFTLLLALLCCGGLFLWAERQCAEIDTLVKARGIPSAEASEWMSAGDYTVAALDRPPVGTELPDWVPLLPDGTRDGLRRVEGTARIFLGGWGSRAAARYIVEMQGASGAYSITLVLDEPVQLIVLATRVIMIFQLLSLLSNLLKNAGTIKKVLRPISELAAAAARLNTVSSMSPEELQILAGKLSEINGAHLDTRLKVDGTQRELRTLAEAINAMLDRIGTAYQSQMRFVSDASHELRTPIAVIQGYANLLGRWGKDDPATAQEAISAITAEAKAMQALVEQLLFLARGDNDTMKLEPEPVELTALAAEVLRETSLIDQTHAIEGKWEAPIYVLADPGLLKQAVRVLVDNAVKYTPGGGGITVGVADEGGIARLSVLDEGAGIAKDDLPYIFDRFYRTDESRTRQSGGAGLGLSIAKWIVDKHGGWFEVTSREGIGTRMTIVLPAHKV